jgi:two-component system chemotaxis sensor kinase CheA
LIYLDRELGLANSARDFRPIVYILVLQSEGCQFGLVVDSIRDTEEIVVKPLGKELKSLSVYAGATIMGDGLVALILDIPGLARRAKVVSDIRAAAVETQAQHRDVQSLLLFSTADSGQAAIPLARVARLEEVPPAAVERAGRQEVLQYRGEIMPLILLNHEQPDQLGKLQVVVCNYGSARVGLVVDRILDAIDDSAVLQPGTSRPGILGSGIVKKRVTDFIDIDGMVRNSGSYV